MGNRLSNAGFIDLAAGWTASAELTLAADEAVRGAPGRIALVGSGNATAPNQTLTVQPATGVRPALTAGDLVEASAFIVAFVAGEAVAPTARLVFRDAGGASLGAATDLSVMPAALSLHGEGVNGLSATFRRAWGRAVAPAGTASATIEARVTVPTSGQVVQLAVLKPLVDTVATGRSEPLLWDPGVHAAADLQLPAWPNTLKPFQAGPGSEPKVAVVEFEAGPSRPTSRSTSLDPARRFNGTVRCDPVQRNILEAFWRSRPGDFWIVEPDSERLCVGAFAADGAPRMAETRGPTSMISVGLWLETA